MTETVWTPDQAQKPDAELAASLLLAAIKEAEEHLERLHSAYHTLTGEWI